MNWTTSSMLCAGKVGAPACRPTPGESPCWEVAAWNSIPVVQLSPASTGCLAIKGALDDMREGGLAQQPGSPAAQPSIPFCCDIAAAHPDSSTAKQLHACTLAAVQATLHDPLASPLTAGCHTQDSVLPSALLQATPSSTRAPAMGTAGAPSWSRGPPQPLICRPVLTGCLCRLRLQWAGACATAAHREDVSICACQRELLHSPPCVPLSADWHCQLGHRLCHRRLSR